MPSIIEWRKDIQNHPDTEDLEQWQNALETLDSWPIFRNVFGVGGVQQLIILLEAEIEDRKPAPWERTKRPVRIHDMTKEGEDAVYMANYPEDCRDNIDLDAYALALHHDTVITVGEVIAEPVRD